MSIAETIVKEHHLIRDYIDKVQAAAEIHSWEENPPAEFFRLAIDFNEKFVEKYHHIGENIVFPILVEKQNGRIDSEYRSLENQHETARYHFAEFKRCLKGYEQGETYQTSIFWRSLASYISFLRAHLNKENHIFLPLIDRMLGPDDQKEIEKSIDDEINKLGRDYLENCRKTLDQMTSVLEKAYGDRYRYLLDSVSSKRVNYRAA